MKHTTNTNTTNTSTSSGCLCCGLVQGLVLGASSSSRRSWQEQEQEQAGWFGCDDSNSACCRATCSWVDVHAIDIIRTSSLKFIAKNFLKKCRTRFVLIVCCTLALLMCVCVGAGSPARLIAPTRGHNLRFASTGKIFSPSSSFHLHLHFHQNILCSKVSNLFFRGLKYFFRSKQVFEIFLNRRTISFWFILCSSLTMNILLISCHSSFPCLFFVINGPSFIGFGFGFTM